MRLLASTYRVLAILLACRKLLGITPAAFLQQVGFVGRRRRPQAVCVCVCWQFLLMAGLARWSRRYLRNHLLAAGNRGLERFAFQAVHIVPLRARSRADIELGRLIVQWLRAYSQDCLCVFR